MSLLLLLPALLSPPSPAPVTLERSPQLPLAIEREVHRIAREVELWPGFSPLETPLAIFTGDETVLFRHPAPPEGFSSAEDGGIRYSIFPGRFPGVVSNSTMEMGGRMVATLLADGPSASAHPTTLAAVALHEAFHVFQRAHHPGWVANEGDVFLYPVDRSELVALRFLETEGLARALRAPDLDEMRCWTREALDARQDRFAAMAPPFVAYERNSELNEGLAQYIQLRAEGEKIPSLPEGGFPPEGVRSQSYAHGAALALLLDRMSPGWQGAMGPGAEPSLDELLAEAARSAPAAVRTTTPSSPPCSFTSGERAAVAERADVAVALVMAERTRRREGFESLPGWRIVVEAAAGAPLGLRGFDPMNVFVLADGLHHTRLLHLGNDAGEVRLIREGGVQVEAITEGAGSHPLFQGVRRIAVAGLGTGDLRVSQGEEGVEIEGAGIHLRFAGATLHRSGEQLRVVLGG